MSLALADFNSMIFLNIHVQRGMFGLWEQEILLKNIVEIMEYL